jgi:hypothetical protein
MSALADLPFQNLFRVRVAACLLVGFATGLQAPAAGSSAAGEKAGVPLWRQAAERIVRDGKFWATQVSSVQTIYDGNGQLLGSVATQDELDLATGRPVWKQKSRVKKGEPGFLFPMDLGIQKKPGVMLQEYDAWTLLRKETRAGVPVEVWKGVETAEPDNTATAYLDAETARPLQIVFTVPFSNIILGKQSFVLTVEYGETAAGVCLPSRSIVDHAGRLFLLKRHIHIESEYRDWRSVAAAAPAKVPST